MLGAAARMELWSLTDGDVNLGQAEVIVDSVKDLSPGLIPPYAPEGEQALIGAGGSLDPAKLGQLGRRLEELLDPTGCRPGARPRSVTTKPERSGNGSSP